VNIGVLALQGAFAAHMEKLLGLGVETQEVRTPSQMDAVDVLVMPGGESTTMSMLLESSGLYPVIEQRLAEGMAVFGTCAGMILLADDVQDGRPDQRSFAREQNHASTLQRNGYGRQVDSFETELTVRGLGEPAHGVFIRAPRIVESDPSVEVLATARGDAVLVQHGNALAASFHPELSQDDRIHRLFLESVA